MCRAEDEEDIVAASQAKAEQVAELAEFNENIPLEDGESRDQEEEELSKAEQEIAALVEQVTVYLLYIKKKRKLVLSTFILLFHVDQVSCSCF